ncbi:hypothetical protein HYW87_03865 [Candidatus Roizmanbacteria bacterium]|nr:hypothetical protein [Candidatus Roizmanbacteria bacterium]
MNFLSLFAIPFDFIIGYYLFMEVLPRTLEYSQYIAAGALTLSVLLLLSGIVNFVLLFIYLIGFFVFRMSSLSLKFWNVGTYGLTQAIRRIKINSMIKNLFVNNTTTTAS